MISAFHFLRPAWLFALLPLAVLLGLIWRHRLASGSWAEVVDAPLLPHLLIREAVRSKPRSHIALGLGGLLAILALAGPTWHKLKQPVFRRQSSLVVLLDLSRSMDAADIKPSRLERAKLKLRDILRQRKEGDTALIVFAATPFVVTPLTTDTRTIASQLDVMSTDLMPAQGSRPDRAIVLAQKLLKQTGVAHGGVLLITDGINGPETQALRTAISNLIEAGHRLSVLGVGTSQGAPIPDAQGGFVQNAEGAIVIPKLDDAVLAALARQGHGVYRRLSTDDSDFHALLAPFDSKFARAQDRLATGVNSDQWRDEGPWLLLPLLLLGALAFRRGALVLLLLFILPHAHPAYAFDWSSLWLRADQRGQRAMVAKQPQIAAQLFHDRQWRAAADYRAGNYPAAADDLKGLDDALADYNRGDALAHMGRLPEALSAYEAALKRQPGFADARHNRDLLEKLMKKPPQQSSPSSAGKQGKSPGKREPSQPSKSSQPSSGKGKSARGRDQAKQAQGARPGAEQHGSAPAQHKAGQQGAGDRNPQDQVKNSAQRSGEQTASNAIPAPSDQTPNSRKELSRADQQWLRRVPDDPGGLWRRKFLYQYKQQQNQGGEKQAW